MKIEDITIETKIGSYIFLNHPGSFRSTDTKTKIPSNPGDALYIDVAHEVEFSISPVKDYTCHGRIRLCMRIG